MYLVTTILVFMTIFLVIHEELEPGKSRQAEKRTGTGRRSTKAKMRKDVHTQQQVRL